MKRPSARAKKKPASPLHTFAVALAAWERDKVGPRPIDPRVSTRPHGSLGLATAYAKHADHRSLGAAVRIAKAGAL